MATGDRKYSNTRGSIDAILDYYLDMDEEFADAFAELDFGIEATIGYLSPVAAKERTKGPDDIVFPVVNGQGAALLGLTSMTRAQFEQLYDGKPDGYKPCKTAYRKTGRTTETGVRNALVNIDLAPPKDVTAYVIACPYIAHRNRLFDRLTDAANEAMRAVEEHALLVRVRPIDPITGERMNQQRIPARLIYTQCTQLTARSTEESKARVFTTSTGEVQRGLNDMHIHQHVLLMTLAFVPDPEHPDQLVARTLDTLGLKRHAGERDNIYMAAVARGLEAEGLELDYKIVRNGKTTWTIKGTNPEAREYFSTNSKATKQLARALERKLGRPAKAHELRNAMYVSRMEKDNDAKELDTKLNCQLYRDALAAAGLTAGDFNFRSRPKPRRSEAELDRELIAKLSDVENGLCRAASTVAEEHLFREIARCNVGVNYSFEELKAFTERYRERLLRIEFEDGHVEYTTHEQLDREVELEQQLVERTQRTFAAVDELSVQRGIREQFKKNGDRLRLTTDQRDAVRLLTRGHGISLLVGKAGAGKSRSLKVVVDVLRQTNPLDGLPYVDRVFVVSQQNQTANNTARKIGADREFSVERFAKAMNSGREPALTDRDLLVIDEVALLDSHRLRRLLDNAGDAQIVLSGDAKQQTAIGPSGWLQRLGDRLPSECLTQTFRHSNPLDRQAFDDLRDGNVERAVDNLARRQRIHVSEQREDRVHAVMEAYRGFRTEGLASEDVRIIVDSSNLEIDRFNRFVQNERRRRNEITGDGLHVEQEEQGRDWLLHPGDEIVFLQPHYQPRRPPIRNGQHGTIHSIDSATRRVTIELEDGRTETLTLPPDAPRQKVGLAYAQHTAKFQGEEVSHVLYVPGAEGVTNANSAYSALTREMNEVHVFLDKTTHTEKPLLEFKRLLRMSGLPTPLLDMIEKNLPDLYENRLGVPARAATAIDNPVDQSTQLRKQWVGNLLTARIGSHYADTIVGSRMFYRVERELDRLVALGTDPEIELGKALIASFERARDPLGLLVHRLHERVSIQEYRLQQELMNDTTSPRLELA